MTSSKDRWLAANLSLTIAGLGQLYAGRTVSGVIFLLLEMASWSIYAAWVLIREVPTLLALGAIAALPILKLLSLIHARRAVLVQQPAGSQAVAASDKNPWLSFFMSRFIPGLGHAYAGRWVRAALFLGPFNGLSLALFIGWYSHQPPEALWNGAIVIAEVVMTIILIDAFLVLRGKNAVPHRATVAFLLLFLITTQGLAWAKILRTFVVEVYRIPSSAMEPTLMGDASGQDRGYHPLAACPFRFQHTTSSGDRILVSKLAYVVNPVERYDLVVFKFPLNQSKSFVKRVVGLPGEEFMIHHGNIFVKGSGDTEFRIARRSLRTQDSIWIPVNGDVDYLSSKEEFLRNWNRVSTPDEGKREEFSIDRGELTSFEGSGSGGIRFERPGRIDDGHGQEVGELQLAFEFEITKPRGVLFAEVANEFGKFEVDLATDQASELRVLTPGKEERVPLEKVRLTTEQRHHLAFSVYDGMACVCLDGEEVGRLVFIDRRSDEKLGHSKDRFVAFGAREITFKVRKIRLGRDLYYKGKYDEGRHIVEDQPLKIPAKHFVMFGDNVENSHDSRSWSRRTFVLRDGRTVVVEAQDVENSRTMSAEEVMERYHLAMRPTLIVSADEDGNPWALYSESALPEGFQPGPFVGILKEEAEQVGFHFVEEKFIVGRVQKVWWPLGRARPIR